MKEREVKLGAWPGFAVPALDGIGDTVTAPLPSRRLEATYYDTPDLRLTRWGLSLRHRVGDGTGWTVKLPDDDAEDHLALVRRELLFEGEPGEVPRETAALLIGFVRSSSLGVVARLRTERSGVELRDAEDQRIVEVVDDEVTVFDGRRVAARFREVEVEFSDNAPDDVVRAVLDRLHKAGARDGDQTPKIVRALSGRLGPPEVEVPDLDDDPSAAAAIRAAIAGSVIRLIRHDPGVRIGDDAEDVHQARVGTRRLRSDLRTFRSLLDRDWVRSTRAELRWLGGHLGEVRDADVLLERLRRQTSQLPARDAVAVAGLLRRLARQREAARERLLEATVSARYVELLDGLVADVASLPTLPESDEPAAAVFPSLVARPWKHLSKRVESLAVDPADEELHEVRILAKRCRYAAEAAARVVGKPARAWAKRLAEVQTVLGDHQDAVVAETWLREAAARAPAGQALVAGALIALQRAEAAAYRAAWPKAWKAASSKKLRAWIG